MEVLTLTIVCPEGHPPADDIFAHAAARSQYLLDLLAQIPDPRKRRGRRHPLAGLLAAGIAAVIAGSRSFVAIGQRAADAGRTCWPAWAQHAARRRSPRSGARSP
jgi:DDE_Tnp_1-associated